MQTVNSLSGGKTSAFIAANYPADIDVFALVCIDNHNANAKTSFKVDAKVKQMVNDKLQRYCADQHEFLATAEDPIIIKTMFDLEQHIGREIIWVRGIGFNELINQKQLLPNKRHRICTTKLKIEPIFNFLYRYHELPVKMRIGYRADEAHRADTFRDTFIFSEQCEYRPNSNKWVHRWTETPFRIGDFPLIENGVVHLDVVKYWQNYNVPFAKDTNCQFCFWKPAMQLRENFETNPSIMAAGTVMEAISNNRFHDHISLIGVKNSGLQIELFGGGTNCHGGYCIN